jgi:hypothetical protein
VTPGVCEAPGCDAPAVWAVHPLPLEGGPDVVLVCDAHADPLDPFGPWGAP